MLLDEHTATVERFERQQERLIRNFGYGATAGAQGITRNYLEEVAAAIEQMTTEGSFKEPKRAAVLNMVRLLPAEIIALSALTTALHCAAHSYPVVRIAQDLGVALAGEIWVEELKQYADDLAARTEDPKLKKRAKQLPEFIEASVRKQHGSLQRRKQTAKALAKKAGFTGHGRWSQEEYVIAGSLILDVLLTTLSDVFVIEDNAEVPYFTITEAAAGMAADACDQLLLRNPMYLPCVEPALPWTGLKSGGPHQRRPLTAVIRSRWRETQAAVRDAIASGQMQPTLDALNAVQATPWTINTRILDVMRECAERGIAVDGLPPKKDYAEPAKDKPWDDMSDLEQKLWLIKNAEVRQANRALIGERLGFKIDMTQAEELARHERFYTPCNLDWRGRVYAMTHFNFQREDKVRALFLFADGEPIGEQGLYWLKVHVANCGDFDKISKRPFEERVKWVDENLDRVSAVADAPLTTSALSVWTSADKPFLFLASCIELCSALRVGKSWVTKLPVSWDGSCSGLQHLCAMTRAPEGRYVNLTNSEEPQDVYQLVADAAAASIRLDVDDEKVGRFARMALDHGVTRTVVKRNVMTYSYSSRKFGMAKQQVEDLMDPLGIDVLSGKIEEHPFGDSKSTQFAAARYLAGKVFAAIETVVEKPAQAMEFLQKLARALAHEGKPLQWTTPTGLPWSNRYHAVTTKNVRLWLHDKGVVRKTKVAVGHEKEIDKDKASNGVAPNFVHALDAAHLLMTVNAAKEEGINSFALVHDSFGCLASRAERFHGVIREQFTKLYTEHDVLAEVFEQAKCDLTNHNWDRLPEVVIPGNLKIEEVLNAKYAFA